MRLRNPNYDKFIQGGIIFWNINSLEPSITLTMKDNEKFSDFMTTKLNPLRPFTNQWDTNNNVEKLINFKLPEDKEDYEKTFALICDVYAINNEMQTHLNKVLISPHENLRALLAS